MRDPTFEELYVVINKLSDCLSGYDGTSDDGVVLGYDKSWREEDTEAIGMADSVIKAIEHNGLIGNDYYLMFDRAKRSIKELGEKQPIPL